LPRRKYGHMVRSHQPVAREKCRYCRLGWNCPVHGTEEAVVSRRQLASEVRRTKAARRAAKGRR
jgi:hypothetical protein